DRGCAGTVRRALYRYATDARPHRRGARSRGRIQEAVSRMNDKANIPASKSPFWRFSIKFYAAPGVPEACIALQDEAGVDVNVLFFLLWNATRKRALDREQIADIERRIGPWREMAVVPL